MTQEAMQARSDEAARRVAGGEGERGGHQKSAVADNRAATTLQKKLAASIESSPRIQAIRAQIAPIQAAMAQRRTVGDAVAPQGRFAAIQRVEESEEEPQQGQFEPPRANNTGLPDSLKSGIENLSGFSMNDVKVHYNSPQPAQLQAHAYAQGSDIHLAPGQERHLPHEAWHVVQQKQGRVSATLQEKGAAINDDTGLETEADAMGAKARDFTAGAISQLKCDKCDGEEDHAVQRKAVVQRYKDCTGSDHATTVPHQWVQNQYITAYGGVREFYFEWGEGGSHFFVDIVDGKEIYEIKPKGKGNAGLNAARSEANEYLEKLNEDGYGCKNYDYVLGATFGTVWQETGFGRKFTAWSPEKGVILYTNEEE